MLERRCGFAGGEIDAYDLKSRLADLRAQRHRIARVREKPELRWHGSVDSLKGSSGVQRRQPDPAAIDEDGNADECGVRAYELSGEILRVRAGNREHRRDGRHHIGAGIQVEPGASVILKLSK